MDVWSIVAAFLVELRATCPRQHGTTLSCASRMHQAASAWLAQTLPTLPDRFEGQEKFGDLHVRTDAPFVFTLA